MSCGARPLEAKEKECLIAKLTGTYGLRDRVMVFGRLQLSSRCFGKYLVDADFEPLADAGE
jgi:hypothetical protein